ncbi:MAG TPA: tripartite tricarboxylate transporter TctB family protein [Usitatibacter sp.]|nr:tripartite tricarboxylate transporter TctB family protein [Usitatibacter sp.]
MKIGHPKNFWGGLIFAAIGAAFALIAKGVPFLPFMQGYAMGTPARMGPAFFPFWLGLLLFFLGLLIAFNGMREEGGEDAAFPKFHWKPNFWVLGAVVVFGIIMKPIGMLLAGVILIVLASIGSAQFELKRSLILGVLLSIFCAAVFVFGLKLPIPLCPDIESLQTVGICRG